MNQPLLLTGRRCLITGAYGTLGAAISRALWAEGADLILIGRTPARLMELKETLQAKGPSSNAITLCAVDLAAPDAINTVVQAAADGLDVLVNNAAVQGPIGPLWENDWDEWQACLHLNLIVPVGLCRALTGRLSGSGHRGKIINISGGGSTGPRPNFTAYSAAKTGLVRFTESFAHEVKNRNIDVNAIAPGALSSAMTQTIMAAGQARAGVSEVTTAAKVIAADNACTTDKARTTDKATALCCWLASDKSNGITGRLLAALWDPWPTLEGQSTALNGSDAYTLRRIVPE